MSNVQHAKREKLISAFRNDGGGFSVPKRDDEIEELRERVRQLEDLVGSGKGYSNGFAALGKLSPMCRSILGMLMKRDECSRESFVTALWTDENKEVEPKTIDIHICQLRKVLRFHDIEISLLWGFGWCLYPPEKLKIRKILKNYLESK